MECILCRVKRQANKVYSDYKFWIGDCIMCGKPIIVARGHTPKISEKNEGLALEIAKKIYGDNVKLNSANKICEGHWHSHIV